MLCTDQFQAIDPFRVDVQIDDGIVKAQLFKQVQMELDGLSFGGCVIPEQRFVADIARLSIAIPMYRAEAVSVPR